MIRIPNSVHTTVGELVKLLSTFPRLMQVEVSQPKRSGYKAFDQNKHLHILTDEQHPEGVLRLGVIQ
jgi:hypothetical protein